MSIADPAAAVHRHSMDAENRRVAARALVREALRLSDDIPGLLNCLGGPLDVQDALQGIRDALINIHNRLIRVEMGLQFLVDDAEALPPTERP